MGFALERGKYTKLSPEEQIDVVRDVIWTLKSSVIEIVQEMKSDIESGKYTLIIADDTSGRIPAVIYEHIINTVHSRNKKAPVQLQGLTLSMLTTLPWPRRARGRLESMARKSRRVHKNVPPRALVVTDMIAGGGTMRRIGRALSLAGISFDISNLSSGGAKVLESMPKGTKFYSGQGGYELDGLTERLGFNPTGLKKRVTGLYARKAVLTADQKRVVDAAYDEARKVAEVVVAEVFK